MSFSEEIYLVLIDKALLGILLALLGFLLSILLERYKAREKRRTDLITRRSEAISECWSLLYKIECAIYFAGVNEEIPYPDNYVRTMSSQPIPYAEENISAELARARDLVEKNRLWMGNNFYDRFLHYHEVLEMWFEYVHNSRIDIDRAATNRDYLWSRGKQEILDLIEYERTK